ncbi:ROK family transcriptional regulator [Rhizobium straminoryzae]|nr:ROK family transcriptional regulator [Rhizobium straminoryzae]
MKIDQRTTRAMNRRLILNLIRKEGALSRADLAAATGLSPAAVTFVVTDLLAEGYLIEGETAPGGGGRRPVPLSINYRGSLAIGVKMNLGSLDCVLTDLSTAVISSLSVSFDSPSPQTVLSAAEAAIGRLLRTVPEQAGKLTGVGFSMPGTIDMAAGVCVSSNRFGWRNVPFAGLLRERISAPVWMEDDTLAFALAQHLFGLGSQHSVFLALAVGVGIGCATVANGVVLRGAHGHAGKLGHVTHRLEGPMCECGRIGCLQTFHSVPAIVDSWRRGKGLGSELDRYSMKEAALQGDDLARTLLQRAGEDIGVHLANVINSTDPEVVVVGGEAVTFGDLLFDPMRKSLERYCYSRPPAVIPDEREHFWAAGAAALAIQGLFNFEMATGG